MSRTSMKLTTGLVLTFLISNGCSGPPTRVIAVTGTNIGVEISQNPANQTPQAKLGYQRTEIAIVPTNRPQDDPADKKVSGAQDTADVLMELRYAGIFSWGDTGGIYQRLAVGKEAVKQKGAAYMFARDSKGELKPEVAREITQSSQMLEGPRQERMKSILQAIEQLDPGKAQDLATNPPIPIAPSVQAPINARFPNPDADRDQKVDPAIAKEMLKMMAVLSNYDDKNLCAWEAALR